MQDLIDSLLLTRPPPRDDTCLAYRKIIGTPSSRVIYFLPFNTPFRVARHLGFIPLEFLACYEMPKAIVSSDPSLSIAAMKSLVADAEQVIAEHNLLGSRTLVVGMSAGTFPATYLANKIGARLCSVASADRGDLAVWHSPATRKIRLKAERKGIGLERFTEALNEYHPAQNLAGVAPRSVFVIGQKDRFIPARCNAALVHAIERYAVDPVIIQLKVGHFRAMRESAKYQSSMAGANAQAMSLRGLVEHYRQLVQPPAVWDACEVA